MFPFYTLSAANWDDNTTPLAIYPTPISPPDSEYLDLVGYLLITNGGDTNGELVNYEDDEDVWGLCRESRYGDDNDYWDI